MIDREHWLERIAVHWMHVDGNPRGYVNRHNRNRPAPGDSVSFDVMRRVCRGFVEVADSGDVVHGFNTPRARPCARLHAGGGCDGGPGA